MASNNDVVCRRLKIPLREHASKALLCKEIEILDKENSELALYVRKLSADKHILLLELYRVNWWNKIFKGFSKEKRQEFKKKLKMLRTMKYEHSL